MRFTDSCPVPLHLMTKAILIVDDEAAIRDMIGLAPQRAGYDCLHAADANEARAVMAAQRPDLILLDWMLPGQSGIEFAFALKRNDTTREIPIIMLTARDEEDHKVRGLEAGAEDYVTKPFSPREFIARVKAVLRRISLDEQERLEARGLQVDAASGRVAI